jgi:CDGSH-type Zn-finger protein
MNEVTIKARHNGPYLVTGPITLTDADGAVYELPEGTGVALCRCGRSRNKPFCDKTHREIGFAAPERVPR